VVVWIGLNVVVMKWTRPLCGSAAMSQHDCKTSAILEPQEASRMKELHGLGVDIAKRVLHAVGRDETGKIVSRKRLSRPDLMPFLAQLPPVLIGIEACGGAHSWARRFRAHGHAVKRRAPPCVKPYVKSNTNESRDAEAMAEAGTRPTMRCVPTKDVAQPAIQALHRVRERLLGERTALVHAVHGLRHEDGSVIPQGGGTLRQAVVGTLESEQANRTPLRQEMFGTLGAECAALAKQLAYDQEPRAALATTPPACQRRMTIPGIGPLGAPALVAAVSDASACQNGRQCAAGLGLGPRQHATGGKERLWGISNRGDSSRRTLLIHGARATMRWVGRTPDRRSPWIRPLIERRGHNRTAVAVANKQARIVGGLLTSHQASQPATHSRGTGTRISGLTWMGGTSGSSSWT
jgi:transposase